MQILMKTAAAKKVVLNKHNNSDLFKNENFCPYYLQYLQPLKVWNQSSESDKRSNTFNYFFTKHNYA